MKKLILISFSIIFLQSSIGVVFASDIFPDVDMGNKNYKAIQYLKDEGVINGFSNGTFGPKLEITRCEFLKIVMEASNITTNNNNKSFPDVSTTFWCNQYASTAKALGVVQGDDDGNFWPQRNISRIEALKILYLLRNDPPQSDKVLPYLDITSDSWFSPYITKAVDANIITGVETNVFGIQKTVKRSEMAEMIYRLTAIKANNVPSYNSLLKVPSGFLKKDENQETNITISIPPVINANKSLIEKTGAIGKYFFDNIVLDDDLPMTFTLNEVYTVSGSLSSKSEKSVTVFITQNDTDKQYTFSTDVDENHHFDIPVNFKTDGSFNIGIIPGLSGESNVQDIVVIGEKSNNMSKFHQKASDLEVLINSDGNSVFSWNNYSSSLSKLVIIQKDKQVVKIISNEKSQWIPDYTEFTDFSEGNVYWAVFLAGSHKNNANDISTKWSNASQTSSFYAVKHSFVSHEKNKISLSNKTFHQDEDSLFKLTGISYRDIRPDVAIILPDGSVKELNIETSNSISRDTDLDIDIYKAPITFGVNIPFDKSGLYFIEINASNGLAIYNAPMYVGNIRPLTPDFRDLSDSLESITASEVLNNLSGLRHSLLSLINQDRSKYDLKAVSLDDKLNSLAQAHSNDMVQNNYFSHLNLQKEGPSTRKTTFDIHTQVGENLAKAQDLISIHEGLMRSAIHRENILNEVWERIGIGISMDAENNIVVVEEFSMYPLNENDLNDIKNSLKSFISTERAKLSLDSTTYSESANDIAKEWSTRMVENNFFDFTDPNTNQPLHTIIQDSGFSKSFSTLILSAGNTEGLIENLSDSEYIYMQDRWAQIGIGLDISENGLEINATIIMLES